MGKDLKAQRATDRSLSLARSKKTFAKIISEKLTSFLPAAGVATAPSESEDESSSEEEASTTWRENVEFEV